jgi:hypothetical protein
MRRLRIAVATSLIAGAALALTAGGAYAQGGDHGNGGGSTTPGVVEATGDGIAGAGGKLKITICAAEGILLTKGHTEIDEGAYSDSVSGWYGLNVYFDVNGCAEVGGGGSTMSGPRWGRLVAALAIGTGLDLRAEGKGIAFIKGTGEWANNNGESGEWTEEGKILLIAGKKQCEPQAGAQQGGGEDGGDKPKKDKNKCATPEPGDTP